MASTQIGASGTNYTSQASGFTQVSSFVPIVDDLLVATFRVNLAGRSIASITDDQGNTWARAVRKQGSNPPNTYAEIWWALSTTNPGTAVTITVNITGGLTFSGVVTIIGFRGAVDSTWAVQATDSAEETTAVTAHTCAAGISAAAEDAMVAVSRSDGTDGGAVSGLGSGWVVAEETSTQGQSLYNVPSGTITSDTVPWTSVTGRAAASCSAVFRPTAVGGTTYNITPTGSITPTGGPARQAAKPIAGAVAPSGSLAKAITKAVFAGALTPTGALALLKVALMTLVGAITPTGALRRQVNQSLAGALAPIGGLAKAVSKAWAGLLALAGTLSTTIPGAAVAEASWRATWRALARATAWAAPFRRTAFVLPARISWLAPPRYAHDRGTPEYAAAILATPGLVAHWRLDEPDGLSAADASGNGRTGTYTGGYTLGASGGPADGSHAVQLNGSSGYVTVPNHASLQIVGDLSIELWCYLDALLRTTLVSKSASREFELTLETTGGLNFYNGDGATTENKFSVAGALVTGTWQHVIVTRTIATKTIRFFVNGAELSGGGVYGTTTPAAGSSAVNLGRSTAAVQYLNGRLDDVALYSRALSLDEVREHYRVSRARPGTDIGTRWRAPARQTEWKATQ